MKIIQFALSCLAIAVVPLASQAVVIEPDGYAAGTDLSNVSPYVTITTTFGASVYASSIDRATLLAANSYATGPLGNKVFSRDPENNSEWFYGLFPGDEGLVFDFTTPVSYVSFYFAELFSDAGCCTDDPVAVYLYDETDTFLSSFYIDVFPPTGHLGNSADPFDAWPFWQFEYSASLIGKIIVGGESEPTTIDRLVFTPVPLPAAGWLFASAVLGLLGLSRRKR